MDNLTANNGIKPIEELSKLQGLMRLDWFGGVSWNAHTPTNPLIHLFLSPVSSKFDSACPRNRRWVRDIKRQEHVTIGAGYLPCLALGQFFKKGNHAPLNLWPSRDVVHFELDTSDARAVVDHRLSDQIEARKYWVSHVPIGNDNWSAARNSRFKILRGHWHKPLPDGSGIERVWCEVVVHEMELIRYYYTNSHKLSKAVFCGDFSEDRLTTRVISTLRHKYSFDESTGTGTFVYQHGFIREDAPIIGRILFAPNNLGFKGVWNVSKSILLNRTEKFGIGPGFPVTSFPFSGKTILTLDGEWLKPRDGLMPFLAHNILDCSHPFPYRRLVYRDAIDPRGDKALEADGIIFSGSSGGRKGSESEAKYGTSKSNEDPSSSGVRLHVELARRVYSGLNEVELRLMDPDKSTYRSDDKRGCLQEDLPNASTGDPTSRNSSSNPQSIQHRSLKQTKVSRNLMTFVAAMDAVKKLRPTWYIKRFLVGTQALYGEEMFSCFPIIASKYRPNLLLQFSFHDAEKISMRRFVCFEIAVNGRFGYLFEAESRQRRNKGEGESTTEGLSTLLIRRPGCECCDEGSFEGFLANTVFGGGWPSGYNLKGFVRHHSVHDDHTVSADGLASRVIALIERALQSDAG